MFHRKRTGIYISSLLQQLPWLEHGFASRNADSWPGEYARVRQVHSAIVQVSDEAAIPDPEGDALVTRTPGRWVGIRTADCVPLLLADPELKVVSAIHAGWRGTVAEITAAAIRMMGDIYGSKAENLVAAIGPCIGECCFQVGSEVAAQFETLLKFETPPSHLDLVEANLRQLVAAGVAPEAIDVADLCTMCDDVEFHSWRRDREASGRMVSAIRITQS